jgi:hypothetical protein
MLKLLPKVGTKRKSNRIKTNMLIKQNNFFFALPRKQKKLKELDLQSAN